MLGDVIRRIRTLGYFDGAVLEHCGEDAVRRLLRVYAWRGAKLLNGRICCALVAEANTIFLSIFTSYNFVYTIRLLRTAGCLTNSHVAYI